MEPWFSSHGARGLLSILTPAVLARIPDGPYKTAIEGLRSFAQFLDSNRDTTVVTAASRYLAVISDSYTGAYEG